MNNQHGVVVYIHGAGGSAREASHFAPLFPSFDVTGFDYKAVTPWDAEDEFKDYFDHIKQSYDKVILTANSIGAYFSLCSGIDGMLSRAFLISPVTDMEEMIVGMMSRSGVSERELCEKGVVRTDYGDELSWRYLSYAREHRIEWAAPTEILYGENDAVVSRGSVYRFAESHGAGVTVMPGGEHWFHTDEQMNFLDEWILKKTAGIL